MGSLEVSVHQHHEVLSHSCPGHPGLCRDRESQGRPAGVCEGSKEVLTLNSLSIVPYPIMVKSGQKIDLQLQLTLEEAVPKGAMVSLKMVKKGLIDLPLPCIEIDGLHLGSCEYTGQHLPDVASDFLCPDYFPDGQTCNLPLMPGEFGSNDPYTITLPDIPDAIANLLGKGKFEVRATVNKEDGSEMTCIWVILELTN